MSTTSRPTTTPTGIRPATPRCRRWRPSSRYQARGGDTLYRYGGEEFLCILPEQSLDTGMIAVERMRNGIQRLATPHEGTKHGVITISAGLAVLDPDSRSNTAAEVLKEADDALYRAKQRGRNRVERVEHQPA